MREKRDEGLRRIDESLVQMAGKTGSGYKKKVSAMLYLSRAQCKKVSFGYCVLAGTTQKRYHKNAT